MGTTVRPEPRRSLLTRGAWCLALAGLLQLTLLAVPAASACHIAAFSSTDVEATASDGGVTLTVVLQGGQPSCEGTVDYATEDGTATAGEDYEEASGTLTFSSGDDREEDVTIVLLADGAGDFQVVLSNPTGSISGTGDPATVTITEAGGTDDATEEPTPEATTAEPTTEPTDAPTEDDVVAEDGFPWVPVIIVVLVLVAGAIVFAVRGNRPA